MDLGAIARKWVEQLPQETFAQVSAARNALPADDPRQKPLSIEDRRAVTREMTRESLPAGLAMAAVVPAEQAAKAVMAAPVIGPVAEGILKAAGVYQGSRSGFHDPMATIGGTWAGLAQGLSDRGMLGGPRR